MGGPGRYALTYVAQAEIHCVGTSIVLSYLADGPGRTLLSKWYLGRSASVPTMASAQTENIDREGYHLLFKLELTQQAHQPKLRVPPTKVRPQTPS